MEIQVSLVSLYYYFVLLIKVSIKLADLSRGLYEILSAVLRGNLTREHVRPLLAEMLVRERRKFFYYCYICYVCWLVFFLILQMVVSLMVLYLKLCYFFIYHEICTAWLSLNLILTSNYFSTWIKKELQREIEIGIEKQKMKDSLYQLE